MQDPQTSSSAESVPVAPAASVDQPPKNPPALKRSYGQATVSSWQRTVANPDGSQYQTWVTTVSRLYRDGDRWVRSEYLYPSQLFDAAAALYQQAVALHDMQDRERQAKLRASQPQLSEAMPSDVPACDG